MRPRIVSLCSGYGGLDLAVEQTFGAVTVAHCEWESAPSLVLAHRWPGVPNLHDVKTADWSTIIAEILTAGYPCQPFSHAGRRKGTDDERHLWPHVAEAIRRIRPRLVVLENVAGHRSMGFGDVLGELAEDGYDAQWTSLRAADIGAPHNRERVFIVAADTRRGPLARPAATGDGLRLAAERRDRPTADADGSRLEGRGVCGCQRADQRVAGQGRAPALVQVDEFNHRPVRDGVADSVRVGGPVALDKLGADAFQRGADRGLDVGQRAASSGCGKNGECCHGSNAPSRPREVNKPAQRVSWGQYEPAVRRWERRLGRLAPPPTETGAKGGQRLSPRFVEWMMGLPAGWVTDVPGISRNDQLKMLGNGVVPQQAIEALRRLTQLGERAA